MGESLTVRRLLVPTDFSDCATAAVRYAAPLASRLGAQVSLVHATALRPPFDPLPGVEGPLIVSYEENDRLVISALEKTRAEHLSGVDVSVHMAFGDPAEAILETSRTSLVGMIVMGTRGREGLARALLGSIAEAVIRESRCPVMTVRETGEGGLPEGVTRILCPINYSDVAAKALRHAVLFASAFDAELVALYFMEDASHADIELEVERLRLWIGDVPLSLRLTCLARHGDPTTQLNEYARAHGIDLVVAGAQQRRGAGIRTTIGSTTDGLTRHAPCPVLTVPAGTVSIAEPPHEDAAVAGWGA